MSDIFKLRVCVGNANIELEGEGELVHTIFSELRENGCANCSLTKHSRDGNKLAEQGNEILEYSWYKSGQNPPA